MVAFLVLSWLFKPHLSRLSNTNPKYLAWSLKERLQSFRIGPLSCGILYLFVNRTSSVFEGFTPSPFSIVHSDSIFSLAVIGSQIFCGYFLLNIIATSSAYATTLQPPPSIIRRSLFTAIFQRRGDSTSAH